MKFVKYVLIVIVVVLVIIQFIRPKKNDIIVDNNHSIEAMYGKVPSDVHTILAKACNDCHSNHTEYPWYSNVQPVAWWLNDHIKDGKRHLNFDEFDKFRIAKQYKRLNDCIKEVEKGDMPLESYTWIHKEAILTEEEKKKLFDWCNSVRTIIKNKYPPDSLIMPPKKKKV